MNMRKPGSEQFEGQGKATGAGYYGNLSFGEGYAGFFDGGHGGRGSCVTEYQNNKGYGFAIGGGLGFVRFTHHLCYKQVYAHSFRKIRRLPYAQ